MTPLAEQVQRLALAVERDRMTREMFFSLVLPLLGTMRAKTAVEAEAKLCTALKIDPCGLHLPDKSEHFKLSMTTVLDEGLEVEQGTPDRLTALVEAIEQDAKDAAAQKAMKIHKVEHYRFVAGTNACQVCRDDSGKIYPVSVRPSHHNNCRCEAKPIRESPSHERTDQQPKQRHRAGRDSRRRGADRFAVQFGGRDRRDTRGRRHIQP